MVARERFYDPRKRPERDVLADPGDTREQRRAVATFVFGIGCFILIASLSFWQATSERASFAVLKGAVAATTELDLIIAESWDDLRAEAEEEPGDRHVLEGYPVVIEFTGEQILNMTPADLREEVLNRSAADVYFEGLDTFAGGGEADIGLISVEGIVQQVVDIYGPGVHRAAGVIAAVAAVVTIAAAVVLAMVGQTYSTLRTAGLAAGFAALVGLAMVYIIGFLMSTIAGSDPLYENFADLFSTSLDVPRRNFAVLLGAGVGLWVLGLAGGLINRFAFAERPQREDVAAMAPAAATSAGADGMAGMVSGPTAGKAGDPADSGKRRLWGRSKSRPDVAPDAPSGDGRGPEQPAKADKTPAAPKGETKPKVAETEPATTEPSAKPETAAAKQKAAKDASGATEASSKSAKPETTSAGNRQPAASASGSSKPNAQTETGAEDSGDESDKKSSRTKGSTDGQASRPDTAS